MSVRPSPARGGRFALGGSGGLGNRWNQVCQRAAQELGDPEQFGNGEVAPRGQPTDQSCFAHTEVFSEISVRRTGFGDSPNNLGGYSLIHSLIHTAHHMRHLDHTQASKRPRFGKHLRNTQTAHILIRMDDLRVNKAVGAELRAARARQDWSRDQLAEISGVPAPTLRRYEDGSRSVPVDTLVRLLAALKITVADIDAAIRSANDAEEGPVPGLRRHHGTLRSKVNEGNDGAEQRA